MAKINKEEYEYLKSLDDKRKWIARDKDNSLYVFVGKPYKYTVYWEDEDLIYEQIDGEHFQFIQWEDEKPYNIQELTEEYEDYAYTAEHYSNAMIKIAKAIGDSRNESEETEVSFKKKLKQEVEKIMTVTDYEGGWTVIKKVDVDKLFDVIDQLDEPTLSEKVQLSRKSADELNRYKERGYSLKDLLVIAGSKQAQEKFARAWLDGYTVEEPKYRARLKVITDEYIASYLRTQSSDAEDRLKALEIGSLCFNEDFRHLSEFTENELKRLDIWDSDQWEIEELEE